VTRRWDHVAAYYAWLGLVLWMLVRGAESLHGAFVLLAIASWIVLVRATPRWLDRRGTRSLLDGFGGFLSSLVIMTCANAASADLVVPWTDAAWLSAPIAVVCGLAWARCYSIECELGLRDARGEPLS
jgi:hypothetical protein